MMTKALVKLIAIVLAVLFVYTAVDKLQHYALFIMQLQQLPFSQPVLHQQAWVVPVVELIIAICLLLPVTRLKALFASLFLLSAYTLYLTWMLESRFFYTCDCGEPFQSLSLKMHIGFTLVCVFFTGVGVVLFGRIMAPSKRASKRPSMRPSMRRGKQIPIVPPYCKSIDTSLINSSN